MPSFADVETTRKALSHLLYEHWVSHELFRWQWWLSVVLLLVPWLVWIRFVDTRRLFEMLVYASCIGITASILDVIGTSLALWGYRQRLVWFMYPPLLPIDLSIIPVVFTLVYQLCPTWSRFVSVVAILGILASCVEPLFTWADIYQSYDWSPLYSIPIYVLLASGAKWGFNDCFRLRRNPDRSQPDQQ
ncbi:hypothetical protein GCM10025858_08600 [Alicyclobacillus sacchari]|uniref:CBO0543 family protein n=1 Tax=Alicyclobacillus sacchari TaxID=392010 RepID=UPI0023EA428D|nr:CBO0543 family protein [Alicyclobacillus sacchari]GMA56357.1 hypothetical protein GCM10025858_08600 [Alicyclobacillus sacchari]